MMFELPEKITVWNSTGNDGFGRFIWSSPVIYDARIAFVQKKFTDTNGDSRVSTSVCYSEGLELKNGSMVFFGESGAISPPSEANDVRALSQTPSGAGDLKKAWFS
jgi:hypothetical protein